RRRAAREQDLDSEGPAHVLAGRRRFAPGLRRAAARSRPAPSARLPRDSKRAAPAAQWHHCSRDRAGLARGNAGGSRPAVRCGDRDRAAHARGDLPGVASMKAIARLINTYFTGTVLLRFITLAGL